MSLKEKIKAASDLPFEKVTVPQWGCDVLVRGMSAGARSWWVRHVEMLKRREGKDVEQGDVTLTVDFLADYACPLLYRTLFDPETGDRIITSEEDAKDVLLDKSDESVYPLISKALELSGIGPKAEEGIKKDF